MTSDNLVNNLAAFQAAQTIAYPEAHKDHCTYVRYLTLKDIDGPKDEIGHILDQIGKGITRRKSEDRKKIRDASRLILANLVHCIYSRTWLGLPTKPELYKTGSYLHDSLFISHRSTMAVLERLRELGWLHPSVKGNNLQHRATMHCPTPELEQLVFRWLYLVEKPFNGEYVFKSSSEKEAHGSKKKYFLGKNASINDLQNMKVINEHLREQSYALHGPQNLIYLDKPDMPVQGGRVYMDLQRLPDNKAKVRLNTFINGKSVVEIDLKANHLRMAAALVKHELPEDPYQEIVRITGCERDVVKSAINRSLGSDHAGRVVWGANNDSKMPIDRETFKSIMDAARRIYGFIPFNEGLGVMLQSLEGQIMIQAQLRLIELGITSLPIHDALMVNKGLMVENTATQVLQECWAEQLQVNFYPAVGTDSI